MNPGLCCGDRRACLCKCTRSHAAPGQHNHPAGPEPLVRRNSVSVRFSCPDPNNISTPAGGNNLHFELSVEIQAWN